MSFKRPFIQILKYDFVLFREFTIVPLFPFLLDPYPHRLIYEYIWENYKSFPQHLRPNLMKILGLNLFQVKKPLLI